MIGAYRKALKHVQTSIMQLPQLRIDFGVRRAGHHVLDEVSIAVLCLPTSGCVHLITPLSQPS